MVQFYNEILNKLEIETDIFYSACLWGSEIAMVSIVY